MAFPPAHMLVGAGVAEVVRSAAPPLPRWRAWAVGAALAVVPDLDFVLDLVLQRGATYHGTFTHSLVATLVVALAAGALAGRRWALLAGAGYGSHLLVDLLDDRGRTNVLVWWPLSDERPLAIARVFPKVPFWVGGRLEDSVRSLGQPEVLVALARQTGVALLLFLALLAVALIVRRARSARGAPT
ncbi:MAG TPA: metal-dependent hydrolase [Longimicrobiaceae bacterium]|nr:metal-dependent hydrolase [Longimicrobiaceae bacterium]